MNKLIVAGWMALLVLSGSGCGCSNTPRGVAEHFTEYLWRADLRSAKEYATEQTRAQLDRDIGYGQRAVEDYYKVKGFKFILFNEAIDGDKAEIVYNATWISEKERRLIHLIKEDGQWKVHEPTGEF